MAAIIFERRLTSQSTDKGRRDFESPTTEGVILTRKKEAQTLQPKQEDYIMELKGLTALFTVALIAFGGVGVGAAMPEDLEGWDTPNERFVALQAELDVKLAAMDTITCGQYRSPSTAAYVEFYTRLYQDKLDKYVAMYDSIMVKVLTTDDVQTSDEIWIGRTGVARGTADGFIVVPYMQRQVDDKVAELEADSTVSNIDTTIVVTRKMTTYPGGPVFYVYHFEVTWSFTHW